MAYDLLAFGESSFDLDDCPTGLIIVNNREGVSRKPLRLGAPAQLASEKKREVNPLSIQYRAWEIAARASFEVTCIEAPL